MDKLAFMWKIVPKLLFEAIIFYLIHISLLSSHHLWILAVLGGVGSNGWYQPIILIYMILFINLGSQNNHNPYEQHHSLWRPSFYLDWSAPSRWNCGEDCAALRQRTDYNYHKCGGSCPWHSNRSVPLFLSYDNVNLYRL